MHTRIYKIGTLEKRGCEREGAIIYQYMLEILNTLYFTL